MGHGDNVEIGVDPIAGLDSSFALSASLVSYLHDYGFNTLDQICTKKMGSSIGSYWLTADELELGGQWKDEWELYTHYLRALGIIVSTQEDCWAWSFNKKKQ